MKIKWLGHASFLITSDTGLKIITDPYKSGSYGGAVGYKPIEEEADIVTVSHEHEDHNYTQGIRGNPEVVKGSGEKMVKGVKIKGVPTKHDPSGGRERGENTVFTMEIDGIRICHLGDLGHVITEEQKNEIGEIDVLLIPVGGYYTIDATQAWEVIEKLSPKIVIPMHFKTEVLGFPIAPVDDFIKGKENVRQMDEEVEIKKEALPQKQEVWVLKHAL